MLFRIQPARTLASLVLLNRRTEHKRTVAEPKKNHQPGHFRIVTYNVHKCRGLDGRTRPQRIIKVLREIDADIVALQEVWSQTGTAREGDQARFIAEELGLEYRFGENRKLNGGGYGNLILSRLPLVSVENYDLSHRGREERGCLRADMALSDGMILHVYNVHLGTAFLERRHQGRRLVESEILTGEHVTGPRILLGDFNEWKKGLASRLLSDHFGSIQPQPYLHRHRTYPTFLPLFRLDHMYFDDLLRMEAATLHRTRTALVASDHLPLVADFYASAVSDRTGESETGRIESSAR
jgi:endonuclease/exonuclease/phosphatase family metal-dependent hydrolase